jgi:lysine 2,3-aminomutase
MMPDDLCETILNKGRKFYFPAVSGQDWNDWHWHMRNRITTIEQLKTLLPNASIPIEALQDFKMSLTPYALSLINAADVNDPIALQVLPSYNEFVFRDAGEIDPLCEEKDSPVPGLTHRYPDRALMIVSNTCSSYCRYCTRKRKTCSESLISEQAIDKMIDYLAKTSKIRDVVISGGDPFLLSTDKLESILIKLRAIKHIEIIRIGTRTPSLLPQRITDELCNMLSKYHPLWVNLHFSHPNECTKEASEACNKLLKAGIPLNSQTVLLKGINDSVEIMTNLVHELVKMRVRPYYLYQCDPVKGVEHFRTTIERGIEIMEGLRGHTTGLCIPSYVIDAPGGGGKIPVGPNYLIEYDKESAQVLLRNYNQKTYKYNEPIKNSDFDYKEQWARCT